MHSDDELSIEAFAEFDLVADRERDRRRAEGAGADLGAGDVDHDGAVRHESAQTSESGDARGNVTVGEGESKDVHARHGQGLQDVVAV